MEGLASQIIVVGVSSGILALIGLTGILMRIFSRLGRLEKSVEVLEKAAERLDAGQKTMQGDLNGLRQEVQQEFKEMRREFREDLNEFRREVREEFKFGAGKARNRRQRRR